MSLGELHGLARVEGSGQVYAWGSGDGGRLGGAQPRNQAVYTPTAVSELVNSTWVSASPWGGPSSLAIAAPACRLEETA